MSGYWIIEETDTFCGEANYSWIRRYETKAAKTRRGDVRAVKSALGWTGERCRIEDYGDSLTLRPAGQCVVAFAQYREER